MDGPANSNLPREVLKWIQSLDLAYSVKNVRRDFANGFLVAEIVSRYYSRDISMHSFDNGDAAMKKRDHWAQLLKVFRKLGLSHLINEVEANHIACLEEGAAVKFLSKMYEEFTQRKLQTVTKKPVPSRTAGYAKGIAVNKMRKAYMINNVTESTDVGELDKLGSQVIADHEKGLQEERATNPERYDISTTNNSKVIGMRSEQGAPKSLDDASAMDVPQVKVKEISVKQLDRNVTHLRASKQMGLGSPTTSQLAGGSSLEGVGRSISPAGNEFGSYAQGPAGGGGPGGMGGPPGSSAGGYSMPPGGMIADNVASLLSTCISRVVDPASLPEWLASLDPYEAFLISLNNPQSSMGGAVEQDAIVAEVFSEVHMSIRALADGCTTSVQQFWKASDLFVSAINNCSPTGAAFAAATEAFAALGIQMKMTDAGSSLMLFMDFSLEKMKESLITNHNKRLGILRVMNAFTPESTQARVKGIKKLQLMLPDLSIFINCLMILAVNQDTTDELLLDLYNYYVTIGLGMHSPKIRACAISLATLLVGPAVHLLFPVREQLESLGQKEKWWEIKAQLLSLAGRIIAAQVNQQGPGKGGPESDDAAAPGDGEDALDMAQTLMDVSLSPVSSRSLKLIGLQALCPATWLRNPTRKSWFTGKFMEVLLSLDSVDQSIVLGFQDTNLINIDFPSCTGAPFVVSALPDSWNGIAMAEALVASKTSAGAGGDGGSVASGDQAAGSFTAAEAQLLQACVISTTTKGARGGGNSPGKAMAPVTEEELGTEWVDVFISLKDSIYKAVGSELTAESAAGILSCYALSCPQIQDTVLTDTRLLAVLRDTYKSSGDSRAAACQAVFENFLRDLWSCGQPYSVLAIECIKVFAKNFSSLFERSVNLQKLLKDFSRS